MSSRSSSADHRHIDLVAGNSRQAQTPTQPPDELPFRASPGTRIAAFDRSPGVSSNRNDEFARFYSAHKDNCLRAVVASIPNADSPADLVSEAFARAFQRWDSVRTHPAPQAWVLRTALNLHRDEWRRQARAKRLVSARNDVAEPVHPIELLDGSLVSALGALPERQRQTLVLRVLLGLSTNETAAELGIDPGTVPVHLRRALASLRSSTSIKEHTSHEHQQL